MTYFDFKQLLNDAAFNNHMKVNLSEQEQTDITNKVVESFDNSFEKGNLVDTFSQVGEFALDQAIKSDVLRDVPVIGLLVSGYKTVVNIKDYHLARKVYRFLYNLQDTTPKERQKFSKKYCESNQESTSLALLSILDQLNNGNMVPIICNLIKAVINEQITIHQFNRLIVAMQRTAFTDLLQLPKYEEEYDEEGLSDALLATGLIYQSTYDAGNADTGKSENMFRISSNGYLLLKYGFGRESAKENTRYTEIKAGPYWGEMLEVKPGDDREMFETDVIRGK